MLVHLDNGFYRIGRSLARKLGGGTLPRAGMERLVEYDGRTWWLSRTVHCGRCVWSVRPTAWRFDAEGGAYLGAV